MLVALFHYHVIYDLEQSPVQEMMPSWILPLYPFLMLGPLAGTLLYSQPQPSSAIPVLIGGIAFQGWDGALPSYNILVHHETYKWALAG